MSDPYKILGIDRSASDDEVKKAYRSMSRKYHPDANVNAPNPKEIEERFKEIQQAYHQIMEEREHGYSSSSFGGYSYQYQQRYGGAYDNEDMTRMQAAANYINSHHYQEALNVLSSIKDKNAQWFFFSAVAHAGTGNNVTALDYAKKASTMDPGNIEYRQLVQQLESGGTWYQGMGNPFGSPFASNDLCTKLCMANLLCNCCCMRPC